MPQRVQEFEDLIAWQKARELTKQIYQLTAKSLFKEDFGLRDQIRRAAVSVMSNIAEGFDRAGKAEFHKFLVICKRVLRRSSLPALCGFRCWLHR